LSNTHTTSRANKSTKSRMNSSSMSWTIRIWWSGLRRVSRRRRRTPGPSCCSPAYGATRRMRRSRSRVRQVRTRAASRARSGLDLGVQSSFRGLAGLCSQDLGTAHASAPPVLKIRRRRAPFDLACGERRRTAQGRPCDWLRAGRSFGKAQDGQVPRRGSGRAETQG
jgi:hypothetical protein